MASKSGGRRRSLSRSRSRSRSASDEEDDRRARSVESLFEQELEGNLNLSDYEPDYREEPKFLGPIMGAQMMPVAAMGLA
jgi:hypothetical protein